ncbi:MAG: hypothetical protein AB7U85_00120 [Alphaproteobacteria bacterium]
MEAQTWTPVDKKNARLIIEKINALHDITLFDSESTRLQETKLSFYDDYILLKATELAAIPPLNMRFLFRSGEIVKLDGTIDAFNTVNRKAKINLNQDNVYAYAKFFLGSLVSQDGAFRIVESIDDVEFSLDPTDEELEKITSAINSPIIKEDDNGFNIETNMIYSDCVYKVNIFVNKNGDLDILNEEVLLSEMPVRAIMLR